MNHVTTQAEDSVFRTENCSLTQPALSLYISNIEKMLGMKLFDQIEKHFIMAAAGELYIEKAKEMLKLQQEFKTGLCDLKNHVDGSFSVGVQLRKTPLLLPAVMARFRAQYPNISIFIHAT